MQTSLKYLLLTVIPIFLLGSTHGIHQSNLELLNDNSNDETIESTIKKPKSALDLEDEKYIQIRQISSQNKRLPALTLALAEKHIDAQEYILGQYYVKIYLRDYSDNGNMDKAWFLGFKTLFMKFKTSESQQALLAEIRRVGNNFKQTFPESIYTKKVIDMLEEAMVIEYNRNEKIATYYEKIGKPKAAQFYRLKNSNAHLSPSTIQFKKFTKEKVYSNLDILSEEDD